MKHVNVSFSKQEMEPLALPLPQLHLQLVKETKVTNLAPARWSSRRPRPATIALPAGNAAIALVAQEVCRAFAKNGKFMFGDRCKHLHGDSKLHAKANATAKAKATAKSQSPRKPGKSQSPRRKWTKEDKLKIPCMYFPIAEGCIRGDKCDLAH